MNMQDIESNLMDLLRDVNAMLFFPHEFDDVIKLRNAIAEAVNIASDINLMRKESAK